MTAACSRAATTVLGRPWSKTAELRTSRSPPACLARRARRRGCALDGRDRQSAATCSVPWSPTARPGRAGGRTWRRTTISDGHVVSSRCSPRADRRRDVPTPVLAGPGRSGSSPRQLATADPYLKAPTPCGDSARPCAMSDGAARPPAVLREAYQVADAVGIRPSPRQSSPLAIHSASTSTEASPRKRRPAQQTVRSTSRSRRWRCFVCSMQRADEPADRDSAADDREDRERARVAHPGQAVGQQPWRGCRACLRARSCPATVSTGD